jgi:hypothetical protein
LLLTRYPDRLVLAVGIGVGLAVVVGMLRYLLRLAHEDPGDRDPGSLPGIDQSMPASIRAWRRSSAWLGIVARSPPAR